MINSGADGPDFTEARISASEKVLGATASLVGRVTPCAPLAGFATTSTIFVGGAGAARADPHHFVLLDAWTLDGRLGDQAVRVAHEQQSFGRASKDRYGSFAAIIKYPGKSAYWAISEICDAIRPLVDPADRVRFPPAFPRAQWYRSLRTATRQSGNTRTCRPKPTAPSVPSSARR